MMEVYPFLEIKPEYLQTLTCDLILDFATLLILTLLIVQFVRRKHRSFELSLFFQMCLCNVLMVLCAMAFDIAPVFWMLDEDNVYILLYTRFLIAWVIDQVFSVTLLAQWLLYVEYTLHQSLDLIRRRYPAAMIPFIAAIIMAVLRIPIVFWRNAPFDTSLVYFGFTIITFAIFAFYIIAAYVVLYREKKRVRIPAYIRLTPTTLIIIVGFVADMFLTDYPVLEFSFALGLLFVDYYMYRRLNNIDPKTGFFNRNYLQTLIPFAKKNRLKGATVIWFNTKRGSAVMTAILKSWEPEQPKTITMGDGRFLMISKALKDSISERFITLVTEQAKNEGIPVEAGYETDSKSPMEDILKKYV